MPAHHLSRSASLAKLLVLLPTILKAYAAPTAWLQGHDDAPDVPPGSSAFWWKLGLSGVLVLLGGVFAGLTLGLMGLDLVNLQVLSTSGTEQEQKDAKKVIKLLERGRHWVLVVLLLSNVVVNESLPIFLDSILGGGVCAVVVSTTLIVIFGEIAPQSVCARYGLRIGAATAPFVLALMYLEFPIAYPIAKLLDYLLGEETGTLYKKAELKTFVGLHRQFGEETLSEDEATIISSVLDLNDKSVEDIMTPLEDIYSLAADVKLNHAVVDQILVSGHSRIPVHNPGDPTDFVGMLSDALKQLISYDPDDEKALGDMALSILPEVGLDASCLDLLNFFQTGRSHILLVSKTPGEPGGAIGVVSLEDVIEEMIGEEIVDETDLYVDIHMKTKVIRAPRKPAAGKLAPLIAGVIERRRLQRRSTAELPPGNGSGHTPDSIGRQAPRGSGFDKVKLRGGGVPERRVASSTGAQTPRTATASPDSSAFRIPADERQPLLNSHRTNGQS
ncbi:uncharacterized protein JCM15063_000959 [Sporobolomyces koalae]|uniref:uncharacterized protein n=1 Tax=Sporobolomyces koalae TaxID=500713 RepID=UPI00317673AC